MPFPYRQHPRLKNHDYTTPGSYFITVCTKNKQQLLWEPLFVGRDDLGTPSPGIEIHLSEYGKTINKYINSISDNYNDVSVDKYVIMPDHIHLLITLKALSRDSVKVNAKACFFICKHFAEFRGTPLDNPENLCYNTSKSRHRRSE